MRRHATFVGAVLGGLAVAAGAFGAHALKDRLSAEALGWWTTAAHYHLAHAIALVLVGVLAARRAPDEAAGRPSAGTSSAGAQSAGISSPGATVGRPDTGRALDVAGGTFVAGLTLFSGSLYALALSGARWLGAVTPVGGVLLLVGWGALATAAFARRGQRGP